MAERFANEALKRSIAAALSYEFEHQAATAIAQFFGAKALTVKMLLGGIGGLEGGIRHDLRRRRRLQPSHAPANHRPAFAVGGSRGPDRTHFGTTQSLVRALRRGGGGGAADTAGRIRNVRRAGLPPLPDRSAYYAAKVLTFELAAAIRVTR